jgi:hypothetical protein
MTAIGLRRNSARLYGFIRNVPLRLVTWVVRNRLTRDHIMASLPSDAATVAWEVTRNTRLRRGEKAAVAAELIDHFREGLAAETAVADLVARFGDPKRAAKLIRRAKLRCRAWPDRLCRRITRAVGIGLIAAVALYGVLTIRYITAEPVVRESLVERTNRAAMAIPESDRAWPLYRQVLTLLGDLPLHPAPSLDDVLG